MSNLNSDVNFSLILNEKSLLYLSENNDRVVLFERYICKEKGRCNCCCGSGVMKICFTLML